MTITDPSRASTPTQGPSTTPLPTFPRRLRKSPTSSPATAHAAADELRSRSLATPLRSPQEPARVGSFLSTISASNSDAEHHRPLRLAAAPANNPLELTAFLIRQTTNPQWFRHNPIKARTQPQMVDAPQPPTFVDTALANPSTVMPPFARPIAASLDMAQSYRRSGRFSVGVWSPKNSDTCRS